MRTVGTYFEQVPKVVIEKLLAQQAPPAENKLGGDAPATKRRGSKSMSETKSLNRKP